MKYTVEWLERVSKAWLENAPDGVFGGMTYAAFLDAVNPSVIAREAIAESNRARSTAIARRNTADLETRGILKRVVNGVLADPNHGPNSPLYRNMGYIPDIERKSGLTRKDHTDADSVLETQGE